MSPKTKRINSVKFYHTDPRNILEDVNSIPELYYLANLHTKANPELALLLGHEAYSILINYFGGTTLYVPTRDELQSNLLGVMSYYYYNIKGLSWNDTVKKVGITPTKGARRLLRNRWKAFKEIVDAAESKVPDLDRAVEREPIVEMDAPIRCEDTYIQKEIFAKAVAMICSDLSENNIISQELADIILTRYE